MGNKDKTTQDFSSEKDLTATEEKRKISISASLDNFARKHLLATKKSVYREPLKTSKTEHNDGDRKQAADVQVSAKSDISQPDTAVSGAFNAQDINTGANAKESENEADIVAVPEDESDNESKTDIEYEAVAKIVDAEAGAETQPQSSEAVVESDPYFIETKPAEQTISEDEPDSVGENADNDIETASVKPAQAEEQVTKEIPEDKNTSSFEPDGISVKESESAEPETPGEKNTLFLKLIKRFKIPPATLETNQENVEQDAVVNDALESEQKYADASIDAEASPKSEDTEEYVQKISKSLAAKAQHEEEAELKSNEYVKVISEVLATKTQDAEQDSQPPVPAATVGNLDSGIPYEYNIPVAPAPPVNKSGPPIPSRRNEKSAAYTIFVILLAAMTLFTVFTYLLSPPVDPSGNVSGDPNGSDVTEPAKLEVFSWKENGLLYLSIDGTALIVVNRDNKLPDDYGDGVDLDAKAAYDSMLEAAVRDGIYIYTAGDYLDYESQNLRYNRYANYHGEDVVDQFMQKAGYSENQLGVAFHVNSAEADYMYSETFAQTPEYGWLIQNAADYGFILRYPDGKESLTGYSFSPWHFRYVGENLAKLMAESGMVIEEYLDIAEPLPEAAY